MRKEGREGRQEGERERRITKCFTGNIFASNHFTNIDYSNYLSFGIEGLRNSNFFLTFRKSFRENFCNILCETSGNLRI